MTPLVSVIIPTYHRPQGLAAAVASVLDQRLPDGEGIEVVIAVSDPADPADRQAAARLAQDDARVRTVDAPRPGPGAARNAGIRAAAADRLAFMDDDCAAQPGWLAAGLAALADADLVQGRTRPAGEVPRYHHSLSVEPLSWLWESCNIFVRREAVERWGDFDEDWNPTGRVGGHMGEDVEWGWRLARGGARIAAAPDALVLHAVTARGYLGFLRYQAQLRHFPLLFRVAPESRRVFLGGHFVGRRHVALTAAAGLGLAAVASGVAGRRRAAGMLALGAAAAYLSPLRNPLLHGGLAGAAADLARRAPIEAVELAAAAYGSVRWRRLLL
ncbi:MAG: hypothetical protein QOE92_122 [Chloroflexota bacterium]|nr:hypothetical protein [Chloroflexota bacterium]